MTLRCKTTEKTAALRAKYLKKRTLHFFKIFPAEIEGHTTLGVIRLYKNGRLIKNKSKELNTENQFWMLMKITGVRYNDQVTLRCHYWKKTPRRGRTPAPYRIKLPMYRKLARPIGVEDYVWDLEGPRPPIKTIVL